MKQNNLNIIKKLFAFLCLIFTNLIYGQISQTVNFNVSDFSSSIQIGKDSNQYAHVAIKGLFNLADTGKPVLPVKYLNLIIPPGQNVSNITVSTVKGQDITLTQPVFPAQRPVPMSASASITSFVEPNQSVYSSSNPYPGFFVKVVREGYFDGSNHIVTVAVYPVQYTPASNQLGIYSSVSFTLNFGSVSTPIKVKKVISGDTIHQTQINNALKKMVANPTDIHNFQAQATQMAGISPLTATSWKVPFYGYVVITTSKLAAAFVPLVNWKRMKGYYTGIVIIDSILADPAAIGDPACTLHKLTDNAGKLRQYLKEAYYNHSTQYALLGGDSTQLPIRYGSGIDGSWFYEATNDAKIPSDLYFSEFNGNWNVDGDQYLGEPTDDSVDLNIELPVGRLLCSSAQDVKNWLNKTLLYEQNPGSGSNSYLVKSFMTEEDQLQQEYQAEYVAAYLPSSFTNNIFHETAFTKDTAIMFGAGARMRQNNRGLADSVYFPHGAAVISEMNNHYGLCSSFNHGGPTGYGVCSDSIALYGAQYARSVGGLDSYDALYHGTYNGQSTAIIESGNGLDNLTNANYPFVFYSMSCTTMPYDGFERPAPTVKNFAECFSITGTYGGPAYIGNTRYGWVDYS